jgi:hypothetical protein
MLTIICGEDTTASRNYLVQLQADYKKKGYFVQQILPSQIEDIMKEGGGELTLFNEQKIYFVSNLTTFIGLKKNKEFLSEFQKFTENKSVEVIDWEEKTARDIKIQGATVKEFKASESIFQLLDTCYPTNIKTFLNSLEKVSETQEEGFIYTMLHRHIRTLILTQSDALPSSVPFWMKKKLQSQTVKWKPDNLVSFYEALTKIDSTLKTGTNLYGIKKNLQILSCYFLK